MSGPDESHTLTKWLFRPSMFSMVILLKSVRDLDKVEQSPQLYTGNAKQLFNAHYVFKVEYSVLFYLSVHKSFFNNIFCCHRIVES